MLKKFLIPNNLHFKLFNNTYVSQNKASLIDTFCWREDGKE